VAGAHEPDVEGYWFADIGRSGGRVLGPIRSRTKALEAEREWLTRSLPRFHAALLGEIERQRAFTKKPQSGLAKHPPQ
jgi:hypothetical protein